jgi:hypothetical protein
MSDTTLEKEINSVISATAAGKWIDPDTERGRRIIIDLAKAIFPPEDICRKETITSDQLMAFVSVPYVQERIRELRAQLNSPDGIMERGRDRYGLIWIEGAMQLDSIIHGSAVGVADKLKAIELAGKMATTGRSNNGDGGVGGNQFNVVIQFSDGNRTSISPTTVVTPALTVDQ